MMDRTVACVMFAVCDPDYETCVAAECHTSPVLWASGPWCGVVWGVVVLGVLVPPLCLSLSFVCPFPRGFGRGLLWGCDTVIIGYTT